MLEEMRKYAREKWVPVILDDSLEYIKKVLKNRKIENILEIGTAIGYSSICFSKFLTENGKIDTIDIDKQRIMIARANIEMHDLSDTINVIEGDALKVISKLDKKYDFIFIDGPKSHYIEYLPICLDLLNDNGVIIADNVNYKGWVNGEREVDHKQRTAVNKLRAFIDAVKSNENLSYELVNVGDGILIITKK